jgi:putative transposase
VAEHLDAARADVLAFTSFPKEVWRQIWSNNPKSGSTGRSAGALTSSGSSPTATPSSGWSAPSSRSNDEWTEGRRYLGLDVLARSRLTTIPDPTTSTDKLTLTTIPALSA